MSFEEKLKHRWENKREEKKQYPNHPLILSNEQAREFVKQLKMELKSLRDVCLQKALFESNKNRNEPQI